MTKAQKIMKKKAFIREEMEKQLTESVHFPGRCNLPDGKRTYPGEESVQHH